MKNADDILETALNSGIRFSAQKYAVTEQEVYNIVLKFKLETGNPYCPCEMETMKGRSTMCFNCEGRGNKRILI